MRPSQTWRGPAMDVSWSLPRMMATAALLPSRRESLGPRCQRRSCRLVCCKVGGSGGWCIVA